MQARFNRSEGTWTAANKAFDTLVPSAFALAVAGNGKAMAAFIDSANSLNTALFE